MSGGRDPAGPTPTRQPLHLWITALLRCGVDLQDTIQEHTMIRPAAPTRETLRRSIADQLLESLDQLVTRHRALALHDEHIELHAELIAAEVAHQLAMTRNALRRHPAVRPAS
jgi:hypothetical protein